MKRIALVLTAVLLGTLSVAAQETPAPSQKSEPHDFLLLGLQFRPAASGLANLWVVSEGGDFTLFGPLLGGYEIGMFHRATDAKIEYRFKTFFNFKFETFRSGKVGAYFGVGGGLLEVLRTEAQESRLNFVPGYQAILGLRVGPPFKDKIIIELHVLGTNESDNAVRVHLLAGARF